MAKTTGPLLSLEAHGTLSKLLTYSKKRTGSIARSFHKPNKEVTLKQWTQRHIIGLLTAHWQCMTAAEKLVYEGLAKFATSPISGFNYFIKVAQADLYTHHGLCGYWSMNESTGAQVTDYSGNGNHGTLGPTYPSDVPSRVNSITNKFGKALSFDGINDRVKITPAPTNTRSIEFWTFFIGPTSGDYYFFNIGQDAFTDGFLLRVESGNLQGQIRQSNDLTYKFYSAAYAVPNDWEYYAITLDINTHTIKLYKNTALIGTATAWDGTFTAFFNNNMYIGTLYPGQRHFKGLIDEMRTYNRILSLSEIQKHYNLLRLNKKRQPLLS